MLCIAIWLLLIRISLRLLLLVDFKGEFSAIISINLAPFDQYINRNVMIMFIIDYNYTIHI